MIRANKQHTIGALIAMAIAAVLLFFFEEEHKKPAYFHNEGKVFGTYYNIRYEATEDLHDSIQAALTAFDNSLSMFNHRSVLSAVNANRDTVTDVTFETMWEEATRVYQLSHGAFDITVAPLVNYWGFGNIQRAKSTEQRAQTDLDSIRTFVGFDKVMLFNHKVIKCDQRVQIDGGAVAKGQACDVIAQVLRVHGSANYLVDIGGEVVCHGVNPKGEPWHVGITKPNLNNEGAQEELQEVLALRDACMATSGNYRNYYYDGEQRRSHTIDPRTGYPVQHSVLSATIVSSTCMRADALATACMVLGEQEALDMVSRAGDAACYLIVARKDSLVVVQSPNWRDFITK